MGILTHLRREASESPNRNMKPAELVADCPRCKANAITFDVIGFNLVGKLYGWRHVYEAFAVCRHCRRATTFVLEERHDHDPGLLDGKSPLDLQRSLNEYFTADSYISLKDEASVSPPEHAPDNIAKVFREGATSLNVQCWNAAGAMFRACIDLATRPLLPQEDVSGLNRKIRRNLGLRLPWLFDNGKLASDLRQLSTAIREDGNDGAHEGTLTKADAEDLMDFTLALLARMFTEPKRIELAEERRQARRAPQD